MKKSIFSLLAVTLTFLNARAQELDIDISGDGISIDSQEWYENPIFWVIGLLLLILIVVLVTRTSKAQ